MYFIPVLLLALLGLLAAAFILAQNADAEAVINMLLATALGGSIVHLQVLVNARMPVVVVPVLLLSFAVLLSFSPRISYVAPILFLLFILTTLGTTCLLLLHPKSATIATNTSESHISASSSCRIEALQLQVNRVKCSVLWCLLITEVAYTTAMAFWTTSVLITSTSSSIFTILETIFIAISLLFVLGAYYQASLCCVYVVPGPDDSVQRAGMAGARMAG